MKNCLRKLTLLVVCFACVACQSTPKTKPLTAMTDEEKKAAYMYGPVGAPPKEHPRLKKALVITGAVLILVPIAFLIGSATQAAREGKQVQIGK